MEGWDKRKRDWETDNERDRKEVERQRIGKKGKRKCFLRER